MAARKSAKRGSPPPLVISKKKGDDEEDEDDDDSDDEEEGSVTYDPSLFGVYPLATHVAIEGVTFHALVAAKAENDKQSLAMASASAKQVESLAMGYQSGASRLEAQLDKDREYGNRQREIADEYRRQLNEKDRELSQMIRSSEDAKLERERLAAEARRSDNALRHVELELNAKLQQKQMELDAIRRASAPVFAAAGQGLGALIAEYGPKMGMGLGGGAPPTPKPAMGAAPQAAPEAQPAVQVSISKEGTGAWSEAFLDVYNSLGADALACFRALLCSSVVSGAPPFPDSGKQQLMLHVFSDAGEDKVSKLIHLSAQGAYAAPEGS